LPGYGRPTDNALTERFFGTVKQEEIHIVSSYPDEHSAWEEVGPYIYTYKNERPHQGSGTSPLLLFTRQTIIIIIIIIRFFLRYWHISNTKQR